MRILITGGDGQLGRELRGIIASGRADIGSIDAAYQKAEIVSTDVDALDITDLGAVMAFFDANRLNYVINCAAMTDVDGCESNAEAAFRVNARGPENLARACAAHDIPLMQISTDYVLEGTDSVPQAEDAPCHPKTIYGESKLAGERAIEANCEKYFIMRTAWLYGREGKNFVRTILRLAREKDSINVVDDQFGSPTNASDLAYEMLTVLLTDDYGIYNCTGNGSCSWYEFARRIVELAGLSCEVKPCSTDEFPRPAHRPAYSILDNRRLRDTVGDRMRPWDEALVSFMAEEDL